MKKKLKTDYTNYKKFCTVLNGQVFIFVGYFLTFTTFILGLFMLPNDFEISLSIWLFTLIGIATTIYYSLNCSNYIYLGNAGICFKEKKYEWTNIYVTMYAPGPSLLRRNYQYNAYFGDRYLSEDEIKMKNTRKNGFYLELNAKRVNILLTFYNKRVQILNHSIAINGKSVLTLVEKHNEKISNQS